jgi:hypothetical protein
MHFVHALFGQPNYTHLFRVHLGKQDRVQTVIMHLVHALLGQPNYTHLFSVHPGKQSPDLAEAPAQESCGQQCLIYKLAGETWCEEKTKHS